MNTIKEKILKVARKRSVFRAADITDIAEPRAELSRMVAQGKLVRVERGLYSLPDADICENHSLAEAVKRYPGGVICLISALYFHGIGTQLPYETWIMRKDRKTAPDTGIPVRFVYSTDDAFSFGIEKHNIEGTEVNIYSPAKTIADCFKYRNKIGLDVAIEALVESWKAKLFTMDELWTAVKICRIEKIIQPYVEMLVQ
jgi:predicted transcriptional regulator of viral defense system